MTVLLKTGLLGLILGSCNLCQSFLPQVSTHSGGRTRKQSFLHAESKKRVVVVGGGWAGFSAADALSTAQDDIEVILLDASPRGRGGLAGGWRTAQGRSVEAGLHGFWRDYTNTFSAMERIGLDLEEVLTQYTPSMLVSESGKVAVAPVLGEKGISIDSKVLSGLPEPLKRIAQLLPPPLDIALLSDFDAASPLSLIDRLSAIGLLGVWADFAQEDPSSWNRYDSISAEQLFLANCGVTPALYRELVTPLLHVLPMTPGYDCSAAAALSCFHVFALQSKGAFDVRWCRGTISEKIFNPWSSLLQERNVEIRGSGRVSSIVEEKNGGFQVTVNDLETVRCDAVVMAVGGTAMKKLAPSCPPITQAISNGWDKLRGITCVAVRIFFRPSSTVLSGGRSSKLPKALAEAMLESPVVVCGPRVLVEELSETGFCIYDLQRLQDEFALSDDCAALEVDFFRADSLVDKDDDEVVEIALRAVAAALNVDPMDQDLVVDYSVVRARNAVSHFCIGSASTSPPVKLSRGLYMCGDWIDRSGHASWSTEKAVVTGRQAVQALVKDFGISSVDPSVIPVPSDSTQLSALRSISSSLRPLLPKELIPAAPWMLYQQVRGGLGG